MVEAERLKSTLLSITLNLEYPQSSRTHLFEERGSLCLRLAVLEAELQITRTLCIKPSES
jgi:hypothetical protein